MSLVPSIADLREDLRRWEVRSKLEGILSVLQGDALALVLYILYNCVIIAWRVIFKLATKKQPVSRSGSGWWSRRLREAY